MNKLVKILKPQHRPCEQQRLGFNKRRKQSGRWILLLVLVVVFIDSIIKLSLTIPASLSLCSSSYMETVQQVSGRSNTNVRVTSYQKNATHWCIISKSTSSHTAAAYSNHFPHAAENILPCWSWFVRLGATSNCGFVFVGKEMRVRIPHSPAPLWQEQLVDAMQCQVREMDTLPPDATLEQPLGNDTNMIQHTVPIQIKMPRYNRLMYLETQEHATALRRLFVADNEARIQNKQKGDRRLQVGLVQRTRNRVITNIDKIVERLKEALPDADFDVTTLQTPWLKEQAAWFASKDVIVAAHGAAFTNAVFCTPGTIVMQIYPQYYFWQSLEPLIEVTGAIALDWYPHGTDPFIDSREGGWEKRNLAKHKNITPPVNEVVDPILYALGRKSHTIDDIKQVFL